MTEARSLTSAAVARHNALLTKYEAGALDNPGLAAAVEAEVVPPLRQAVRLTEAAFDAGAVGEMFTDFAAYVRARADAAELFVEAVRLEDHKILAKSKARSAIAERLVEKLKGMASEARNIDRTVTATIGGR